MRDKATETASRTIADCKRKGLIGEHPNQRLTALLDGLREIATS